MIWFFTVLFEMSVAVLLSQCIGVFGCKWPISSNTKQIILVLFRFKNNGPNSSFAGDATKKFNISDTMNTYVSI